MSKQMRLYGYILGFLNASLGTIAVASDFSTGYINLVVAMFLFIVLAVAENNKE